MIRNYVDPNEYLSAESDSKMIQSAVDAAERSLCARVVIPAFNARRGEYVWIIEETILLPSHIVIEIDNAHLRMADGVFCQMFRNANGFREIGTTPEGCQEDIIIQGKGRAILDGGKHNGLREKTSLLNGLPHISNNLTIMLHNVHNFKIDNLTIRDQRWWGITLAWAWDGVISNVHFEITDKSMRESTTHPWRNQDGIDLRVGCHDVQIFNLTGETCDDVVALTALAIRKPSFECTWPCDHLTSDIYNVTIRGVTARNNHCALIRLLCHNHHKLYNVTISDVQDVTPDNEEMIRTGSCVKIGENDYCKDPAIRCKPGEMHDIFVSNVHSSALAAVVLNCTAQNVFLRNLSVGARGTHAVSVSKIKAGYHQDTEEPLNVTRLENVVGDGIFWHSERREATPFFFDGLVAKNVSFSHVFWRGDGEFCRIHRPQEASEEVRFDHVVHE